MRIFIILLFLVVSTVSFSLISCEKKSDLENEVLEFNKKWYDKYPDFFPLNYQHILSDRINTRSGNEFPSDTIIYQIADEIIEAEKRNPFLDSFISKFGYPEWNYSILKGAETDSFIVSIPFMTNPVDSSFSGILKYYFHPNQRGIIAFIPKYTLDSLIYTITTNANDLNFITSVVSDFIIFEFSLYQLEDTTYLQFLTDALNFSGTLISPRSYWVCVSFAIEDIVWIQEEMTDVVTTSIQWECYCVGDCTPNFGATFWNNILSSGGTGINGNNNGHSNIVDKNLTPLELCLKNNPKLDLLSKSLKRKLKDPCYPNADISEVIDDVIIASCDALLPDQIDEFYAALANQSPYFEFIIENGLIKNIGSLGEWVSTIGTECCADNEFDEACAGIAYLNLTNATDVDFEQQELTECEIAFIISYSPCAMSFAFNAKIALTMSESLFPGEPGDGDCKDAFRHAFWMALNTVSCGSLLANMYGVAHECDEPPEEASRTQMDYDNNEFGQEIGQEFNHGSSAGDIADAVCARLQSGNLYVLEYPNDGLSALLDSNGCSCE